MLNFPTEWRFESPGRLSDDAIREVSELIGKIAANGTSWDILESFKSSFAAACGTSSSWSSSERWAQSDLDGYMQAAAGNAPLFIQAFYDTSEVLKAAGTPVPDIAFINRILAKGNAGYEIHPPNLIVVASDRGIIEPVQRSPSLDQQAQNAIRSSLATSEQFLQQGKNRPAVQEVLWLLETLSTAFQGIDTATGTVQGKYFNKIIADLRSRHSGKTLDLVLEWCTSLHGYLSSPTGGGIRHGVNILRADLTLQDHEARLFCNLIRSYIFFLIDEHARLTGNQTVLIESTV
jgi:hypothetical protein